MKNYYYTLIAFCLFSCNGIEEDTLLSNSSSAKQSAETTKITNRELLAPIDYIAYYPFNGDTKDATGKNTTVYYAGLNLVPDKNGKLNRAYYFNGTSYIIVPKPAIQNEYTISFWALLTKEPTSGTIQTAVSIGSSGGDQLVNTANNYYGVSGWAFTSYNDDGTNLSNNLTSLVINSWVYLVITRDSYYLKAYLNGRVISGVNTNGKNAGYGYGEPFFYIGNRHSGQGFVGVIDEVKIFDRALNPSEIMGLYLKP
ncbi:MAG: LamG domain-containing protein [Flectobacillus sp.]|uniref:LamG domain-containing protein n=1 Tax=Flectobacillus sp. TaxID=50419 RepID=UPI003B99C77C